ncbi:unnamed protein product [Scytosiphon promiscuus]
MAPPTYESFAGLAKGVEGTGSTMGVGRADCRAQRRRDNLRHTPSLDDGRATYRSSNRSVKRRPFLCAAVPKSDTQPDRDNDELPTCATRIPRKTTAKKAGPSSWRRATPLVSVLGTLAGCMAASDPTQVTRALESPPFPDCPYVIPTQEEAFARGRDPSIPGNALWVEGIRFGRMGNLVLGLSNVFRLGMCCKSKMVSLPPKSDDLAPGIFNEGTAGPRWFDFSSAPDVEGFNASTCPANMTWHGGDALYLRGVDDVNHLDYTPGLRECVDGLPRQVGCEAAHIFPVGMDVCESNEVGHTSHSSGDGNIGGEPRMELEIDQHDGYDEQGWNPDSDTSIEGGGSLAIHVRSGDIFVQPVHHDYGQPPLQYYLRVLEERQWDRVDVLTNGLTDSTHMINPVVPALESKVNEGELLGNIHFHKNRTMAEDLVSMLCADALVMAKSSLAKAWAYHTTATRVYFPVSCSGYLRRLADARPEMKVYTIVMPRQEDYSPFHGWNLTEHQLDQMMTFNVTGFEECQGTSGSSGR